MTAWPDQRGGLLARPGARLGGREVRNLEPEALGQARYRLLNTIRDYAAARLAEAGESAAFRDRLVSRLMGCRRGIRHSLGP